MKSLALSHALKKRSKKMAEGGEIKSGYVMHEGDMVKRDEMAMEEDDRMLNQHGEHEEGPEGAWMAEGGKVGSGKQRDDHEMGVHKYNHEGPGNSPAGSFTSAAKYGNTSVPKHELQDYARKEHGRVLEDSRAMPAPKLKGLAEGGFIGSHQSEEDEMDMVGRIMKQREHMYSEGGRVANDDEPMADSMPAEYDDLVLDDHLDGHNSGAADGDDLGNTKEDHDRSDIISKIMRSRAKRDKMPRPA